MRFVFVYNFVQERARAMRVISVCSALQDGSIDMQLTFSVYYLTLKSCETRLSEVKI